MKTQRLLLSLFALASLASAQRPTAYEYHNLSVSSDGTTLYRSSSMSGSMNGSFPPGVIRHTYTAAFTLVAPNGSGIASVPCSASQSGDPSNNFDPQCYANISLIGVGIYNQNLNDSAYCSYAGNFFTNAGTNAQSAGAFPNLIGIVTVTLNSDGTATASMSSDNFDLYYANAQEYFQSECGCQDVKNVLIMMRAVVITTAARITVANVQAMHDLLTLMNGQSSDAHNTPPKGQPNSVRVFDKTRPGSTGKTVI